jgi:hypothetical protein
LIFVDFPQKLSDLKNCHLVCDEFKFGDNKKFQILVVLSIFPLPANYTGSALAMLIELKPLSPHCIKSWNNN